MYPVFLHSQEVQTREMGVKSGRKDGRVGGG